MLTMLTIEINVPACCERPFAAIGYHLKMLQRGPSLRPFVQSAVFCQLKRRCAGLLRHSLQAQKTDRDQVGIGARGGELTFAAASTKVRHAS
jgi:hypothetical protein